MHLQDFVFREKISVYADAFDHDDSEQIFIIPRYNTLAAVGLTNTRVALWIVRLFPYLQYL